MGEQIQIRSADGFEFSAYRATPAQEPRGVVVVIQEIFGVNKHIREVADGYAAEGYLAIAPQLFDRIEPGIEMGYEDADIQRGIDLAFNRLDMANTLQDLQATVTLANQSGPTGVVGYCFGGLLAWLCACEVSGVSAAVCYYGGGIAGQLDRSPRCPVLMHFGDQDAHIPLSDVEKVRSAQPEVEVHVYHADHGFNCDHRGSYDAEAAATARQRSLAHFAEHLRG